MVLRELRKELAKTDLVKKASELPFMEGRDCPICMCAFEDDDEIWQLQCSEFHIFHAKCMDDYMKVSNKKQCPLCRAKVDYL